MSKKTKEKPLYTAVGTIWLFGNQFQIAVEFEIHEEIGAFTKNATLVGIYFDNQTFPTELKPPIPLDLYSQNVDQKLEKEIEQIAEINFSRGRTEESEEVDDD